MKMKMKNTNKMKPWLKGGLIGLGIWLILIVIFIFSSSFCVSFTAIDEPISVGGSPDCPIINSISLYLIYFFGLIIFFGPASGPSFMMGLFVSPIVFFLWGALIGWIYGRFKK